MIAALVIAACAWLNRIAGGGWPAGLSFTADLFIGRIGCGVLLGLAALTLHEWQVALAFGAGFVFWRAFSWGYLIGAVAGGHKPTARPIPSPVEGYLLAWFGAHGGLFARMMFVLPCLIAVAWLTGNIWAPVLAIPFAALSVAVYALAWRFQPNRIFAVAEPLVGALWGALIVLT